MTRDNRVQVYVSDAELARLNDMADQADKSVSHLCRDAILEYTDRDRTERIESEVRDMHDKMDRVLALVNDGHAHTSGSAKHESVPDKARKIAEVIRERHTTPVRAEDVEIAIEDYAGADDRTLKKYKSQLKKRGLLYEHPVSPVWTDDKSEWVEWQEAASIGRDLHEVLEPYGMHAEEYDQIAEAIQ